MEIKVLGSSSKGNCYVVSDGKTRLLLDCGLPVRAIVAGIDFKPQTVAGCLITHSHNDHVYAAEKLAQLYGIRLYASEGCKNAVSIHARTVKAMSEFSIGSFKVLPFDIQHDAPEPLGYLMKSTETGEKMLYFTDTYYLKYRFKGVTHILCEANYDLDILNGKVSGGDVPKCLAERIISSHMSIEHLEQFLRSCDLSKLRAVYLCHLSDSNSNAAEFRERIQRLTGAEVIVC